MQCLFEQRGEFWLCPTCGMVVPRRGDKPPKANCARQWRRKRREKRKINPRRETTLARSDAADIDREQTEARLAVCEQCDLYADYQCVRTASICKRPERWVERVLFGRCERWENT